MSTQPTAPAPTPTPREKLRTILCEVNSRYESVDAAADRILALLPAPTPATSEDTLMRADKLWEASLVLLSTHPMKRTQSKAVKPARKGAVKKYHAIKGRTLLRETDQFRRLPDFPEWEPLGRKPLAGETCETWDGLRFKWRRRNPRAARANKGRNL